MNFTKTVAAVIAVGGMIVISSCGSKTYTAAFSPEETGLNVVKITDESKNTVLGPSVGGYYYLGTITGGGRKSGLSWAPINALAVSPDGTEIAYMTRANKQQNIMVRRAGTGGAATQRTFRHVGDFTWGSDDNLYFIDINDSQNKLCVVNAHAGSLMRQLTSNNQDYEPVLTEDGKKLFFTRNERGAGPSIWSYELANGELTNCARGFQPALIPGTQNEFLCVRSNDEGMSEIWRVNYVNGQETLILSDKERSFTDPQVSPDGEWLLVVGNSVSSINKKKNLDIFAVKMDGSNMVQLTYHPAQDACPRWSRDGKSVFFLSTRANEDNSYNVWKMNFRN